MKDKTTLYKEVAARIVTLIDHGILKEGERIPSIRNMSDSLGVSLNTIKEAYMQLENQYYIESIPQSGFYVNKSPPPKNEPCLASVHSIDTKEIDPCEVSLCRIYGAFQKQGRIPPGIELAIAHTDYNLLPSEKLQKCIVDTIRYNCQDCLDYIISPGDFTLREQISKHYIFHGTQLSSDDIIITNGCQEAAFLALLSICNPGDTVAIETPIFFNFIHMLEALQLKILEIPCTCEEGMSIEALEFALENQPVKAVISIPNFGNPMGSLMPENRKKYLVKLLEKYNVPLIEDDINSDIYYNDRRPLTCKSYDDAGNVILCSSFSKTLAPGLRLGWTVPGRYYTRIDSIKTLLNIGGSSLLQIAVAKFLKEGGFERSLRKMRQTLQYQVKTIRNLILDNFPEGTKVKDPSGGSVLWVELPQNVDSLSLFGAAIEQDIAFAPGPLFSRQGKYNNFIRVSAGVLNDQVISAIVRLGEMVRREVGVIKDNDLIQP